MRENKRMNGILVCLAYIVTAKFMYCFCYLYFTMQADRMFHDFSLASRSVFGVVRIFAFSLNTIISLLVWAEHRLQLDSCGKDLLLNFHDVKAEVVHYEWTSMSIHINFAVYSVPASKKLHHHKTFTSLSIFLLSSNFKVFYVLIH